MSARVREAGPESYVLNDSVLWMISKRQNQDDKEHTDGAGGRAGGRCDYQGADRGSCLSDGTVLYPSFGGGYTNLSQR